MKKSDLFSFTSQELLNELFNRGDIVRYRIQDPDLDIPKRHLYKMIRDQFEKELDQHFQFIEYSNEVVGNLYISLSPDELKKKYGGIG